MCVRQNRSAWASRAIGWCCCATGNRMVAVRPAHRMHRLDLTDNGRAQAVAAGPALADLHLDDPMVISSPRRRAAGHRRIRRPDRRRDIGVARRMGLRRLRRLTTPEIQRTRPDWSIWTYGARAANPWPRSASAPTGLLRWRWNYGHTRRGLRRPWPLLPRGHHPLGRVAADRGQPLRHGRGLRSRSAASSMGYARSPRWD